MTCPPTICLLIVACLRSVALSNLPHEGEGAAFPNKSFKYCSICELSPCTFIGLSPQYMWKDLYQYWFVFMHDQYMCSVEKDDSKQVDCGLYFCIYSRSRYLAALAQGCIFQPGKLLFVHYGRRVLRFLGEYLNFFWIPFCYSVILIWSCLGSGSDLLFRSWNKLFVSIMWQNLFPLRFWTKLRWVFTNRTWYSARILMLFHLQDVA